MKWYLNELNRIVPLITNIALTLRVLEFLLGFEISNYFGQQIKTDGRHLVVVVVPMSNPSPNSW